MINTDSFIANRRKLLSASLSITTLQLLLNAGIIPTALANSNFESYSLPVAFTANTVKKALSALKIPTPSTSHQIILTAPDIAENGASVSIGVISELPNTTDIYILVAKNPNPLAASIFIPSGIVPEIKLYIRMNETSPIHVVVKSNDTFYAAIHTVQVTVGGCAG
ncbi:MAG: thiosulfate oxidation carrier protein SoxY [Pseudomonadota bacterium]